MGHNEWVMGPYELKVTDDRGVVYRGSGDWIHVDFAPGTLWIEFRDVKGGLKTDKGIVYDSKKATPRSARITIAGRAYFDWEDVGLESWAGGKRK